MTALQDPERSDSEHVEDLQRSGCVTYIYVEDLERSDPMCNCAHVKVPERSEGGSPLEVEPWQLLHRGGARHGEP